MHDDADSLFRTVRGYQQLNRRNGGLTPALEDYMEMIYRRCEVRGYARVGEIAGRLHVTPSSASKMVGKLAALGYLQYEQREVILLTDRGREAGDFLLRRHRVIERFFRLLSAEDSLEETELVEHSLRASTIRSLQILLDFFEKDTAAAANFASFREHYPPAGG